jgi:hypothetical protein
MSDSPVLESLVSVYQKLLWIYPADHRQEYGPWMTQLLRDLMRDAYRQSGMPGALLTWIHVLCDLITTASAEHARSVTVALDNRPVSPLPWWQVLLAILPGLLALSNRSGWLTATFGRRASERMDLWISPIACLLIVFIGWIPRRKLVVWAFPALGLLAWTLPIVVGTVIKGLLLAPPPPHSPAHAWVDNLSLVALGILGALLLARQRRRLRMPPWGWALAALFFACGPFLAVFEVALLLLPIAIGLILARRDQLLAVLVVVAAQYSIVDGIYDPSYGILVWTANTTAERTVTVLPALAYLVLTPLCVCRARTTGGRMAGLLLPPLIGLFSGEILRWVVMRHARPYYPLGMLYIRGGGAIQFVLLIALAVLLYSSVAEQDRTSMAVA